MLIHEADQVVCDASVLDHRMTGTNTGSFFVGPRRKKRISHRQFELLRLRDGKIVEYSDSAILTPASSLARHHVETTRR